MNNKTTIILVFLFLLSALTVLIFYRRSGGISAKLTPAATSKNLRISPNQAMLTELEKRMEMPRGSAIIFNLSDLADLAKQPFFAAAKPADKLILFEQEKKAVLFDPVEKKIVNIGPLLIVEASQEAKISDLNSLDPTQSASTSAQ